MRRIWFRNIINQLVIITTNIYQTLAMKVCLCAMLHMKYYIYSLQQTHEVGTNNNIIWLSEKLRLKDIK